MRTGRFTTQEIAFIAKSKLTSKTIASKLNRTLESVVKYKVLAAANAPTPVAIPATMSKAVKAVAKTTIKPTAKVKIVAKATATKRK
jgi:hypothetical protein